MNYSGMAITLGHAFAFHGLVLPILRRLSGLARRVHDRFRHIHERPVREVAGRYRRISLASTPLLPSMRIRAGGVTGKMISPQSISVATAATNMVGKEYEIFRFNLKHSLILCTVVGIIIVCSKPMSSPGSFRLGRRSCPPSPSLRKLHR